MYLGWSTVIKLSHAGIAVSVMRSEVAPLRLVSSPSSIHSQFIFKTEVNAEEPHFLQITVSWATEKCQKWQSSSGTDKRWKGMCCCGSCGSGFYICKVDMWATQCCSFYSTCVGPGKSCSSLNITLTLNDIPPMVDGDSKTRNAFIEESCIAIRTVKSSNLYHPSMCRMKNADRRWQHTILCFAALNVNFVIQRGLMYCCLVYTGKGSSATIIIDTFFKSFYKHPTCSGCRYPNMRIC